LPTQDQRELEALAAAASRRHLRCVPLASERARAIVEQSDGKHPVMAPPASIELWING